jgi:hypothetical protein
VQLLVVISLFIVIFTGHVIGAPRTLGGIKALACSARNWAEYGYQLLPEPVTQADLDKLKADKLKAART